MKDLDTSQDQIQKAIKRGEKFMEKVTTENCYTTEEFVEKANLSGENLLNRLTEDHARYIYVRKKDSPKKYWPKWQLDDDGNVPDGFDAINALLRVRQLTQWSIYLFWSNNSEEGPEIPRIVRLKQGEVLALIKDAGSSYLIQGAI